MRLLLIGRYGMAYKARQYKVVYRQAVTGLVVSYFCSGGYNAQGYAERLVGAGHKVLSVREVGTV
jgi:hypothetical protein